MKYYWSRFENFLDLCHERDIIVQLEIWDPWDHYEDHQSFGGWSFHPFNPKNNINYTEQESGLTTVIDYPPRSEPSEHGFFLTVPALQNNKLVLDYQLAFMDKLLSIALEYPNVLYCINNESGEHLEWSQFWAEPIHKKAEMEDVRVPVTEMRRQEDIKAADHRLIFDKPELYTFLDISQNNAWSGLGQGHYDNILEVRNYISDSPRPINNVKNYGAARHGEEETVARFCRIVFVGSAGARFHRPHPIEDPNAHEASSDYGLGLSPRAQSVIKSLSLLVDEFDIVAASPSNDLLSDREENEAYLMAISGKQYALYFPKDAGDGLVSLDLSGIEDQWELRWLKIAEVKWKEGEDLIPKGNKLQLKKPDNDHWLALIQKKPV